MFERMEIQESIYEGIMEPSHKKPTRADANCAGLSRKMIGESALSNIYPETSESPGKHRKWYVYNPKYILKLSCLIHGSRYSSYEYKFFKDFGTKYDKVSPTKDRSQEPATNKIFNDNNGTMI